MLGRQKVKGSDSRRAAQEGMFLPRWMGCGSRWTVADRNERRRQEGDGEKDITDPPPLPHHPHPTYTMCSYRQRLDLSLSICGGVDVTGTVWDLIPHRCLTPETALLGGLPGPPRNKRLTFARTYSTSFHRTIPSRPG